MKYIPMYRPEVVEGRVNRCEGTGSSYETRESAEAAAKMDGRPYVVADEQGKVVGA